MDLSSIVHKFDSSLISGSAKVKESDAILLDDLNELFNGKINAIRIPNFFREESEGNTGKIFSQEKSLECYNHEIKEGETIRYLDYGVDRFGVSFNTTYNGCSIAKDRYYNNALENIRNIRNIFGPKLSPFDRFRLELDEIWPGNVGIAKFEDRKMMSGIVRVMNRPNDSELISAQPHIDILPKKYSSLIGQFAVNIYLSVPEQGGFLELWDAPAVHAENCNEVSEGDWRSRLGKPTKIRPLTGDLILFNSRVPHAVSPFSGGPRVSIQSFIGLTSDGHLQLWA